MSLEKLAQRIKQANSMVCVGLDSAMEKLPERFLAAEFPQFEFNKWIIDQTYEYVCAYKPNTAFYEAEGVKGWRSLELTMEYLQANFPNIFTICDAKRADIGSTNQGYVTAIFDQMKFDAITLHPYLGQEALAPFLERDDKVSIILCRTSNPGSGEFQEVETSQGEPLYLQVARQVAEEWDTHHNCMLVVGATYPESMAQIRQVAGKMPFLVPGVGAQGGDPAAVLQAGQNSQGTGLVVNSSRGVIFSEDPAKSAEDLQKTLAFSNKK